MFLSEKTNNQYIARHIHSKQVNASILYKDYNLWTTSFWRQTTIQHSHTEHTHTHSWTLREFWSKIQHVVEHTHTQFGFYHWMGSPLDLQHERVYGEYTQPTTTTTTTTLTHSAIRIISHAKHKRNRTHNNTDTNKNIEYCFPVVTHANRTVCEHERQQNGEKRT